MREIVLDTETTGLDPLNGDRIQTFHRYLNPERNMAADAVLSLKKSCAGSPSFC